MPKIVPIKIFNLARTALDREVVREWLDYLGADEFEIPGSDVVTDSALLIALAAKNCYKSFQPGLNPNVKQVRKDIVKYLDNILDSRHGSVLEHSVYTFAIQGVSRVFTAEMNRHRAGWAISEQSLRFIRFDTDIPFWMPESLQIRPDDDSDLVGRKKASQAVFNTAYSYIEECYAELLKIWDMDEGGQNFPYKKKVTSCLRRIVPMGVATGGVWTGNFRALRHVMSMRADSAAEEEIFYVFSQIGKMMIEREPMLFGDFKEGEDGSLVAKYWKV